MREPKAGHEARNYVEAVRRSPKTWDRSKVRTASKLLRFAFNGMMKQRLFLSEVAGDIGKHRKVLSEYRAGKVTPNVLTVEEILEAAGFELIDEGDRMIIQRKDTCTSQK